MGPAAPTLTSALAGLTALPARAGAAARGVLPAAAVRARAGVMAHFRTGTAPDGTRWPRLAHARPGGGSAPLLDTEALARSVTAEPTADGIVLRASHPGARLHQRGGTVRPVRAKALAVPVSRQAKAAGSPRKFGGKLKYVPGKRGGRLVEPGEGGATHYLLVPAVNIPARPFLGFSAETARAIAGILAGAAAKGARR